MISHKGQLILAPRPPMHFLHKTFTGPINKISHSVPSFKALAVLFPDWQKSSLVVLLMQITELSFTERSGHCAATSSDH